MLCIAACKAPPAVEQAMPMASAERGKAAIERAGCAACHTIQGIDWPRGEVAPPLGGLTRRALIAGQVPNQPEWLALYVRNAPSLVPGSTMPAMPISKDEARDIASYLYSLDDVE